MNTFICLAALVAIAFASPVHHVNVAEDTLGNYKFDFDLGDQTRVEERREDGSTFGHFTYSDTDGVKHSLKYNAGEQGFIADSADLPVAPQDTAENIQAHNQHAAIFNSIQANPAFQESPTDDLETPVSQDEFVSAIKTILTPGQFSFVEETPEIVEAKKELYNAYIAALEQ